jgi:hypothetical protein
MPPHQSGDSPEDVSPGLRFLRSGQLSGHSSFYSYRRVKKADVRMGAALGSTVEKRPLQPGSISGTVRVLTLTTSLAVLGCSILHLVALSQLPTPSTAHVVALLSMAMVCLPCVPHLLLAVRQRTWIYTGLLSGGMLAGHALLNHVDGDHAQHVAMSMSPLVTIGLTAGPGATLVLAIFGMSATRRAQRRTA